MIELTNKIAMLPAPTRSLFSQTLRQSGLSVTRGRLLVFELLWNRPPQSIAELYEQVDGRLDRASLYRIIKTFEELQIVHKVWLGWKYRLELGELFSAHHHHLTCLKCGCVVAMDYEKGLEQQIDTIASKYDFAVVSHQVELQGYCRKCIKREASSVKKGG